MKRAFFRPLALLAGGMILVSGGCSGGSGGVTNSNGVVIVHATSGDRFSPSTINITRGTTVRWVADVSAGHTVTPDNAAQAGVWSSASIGTSGQTFEFTFNTAGDFAYHCIPHQAVGMTGTVHVQ
jgi:plastocyanin